MKMKCFFEKKYFIRQYFCHSTVKNLPLLLLNKKQVMQSLSMSLLPKMKKFVGFYLMKTKIEIITL